MRGQVRGLALELLSPSPCVNICHLNDEDICIGCYRSSNEITTWAGLDDIEREKVLIEAKERELTLNASKPF
jgi:predicted Fe-S protein YdhL (DUF1289 family)|tara:strand:+ start:348 stop:563 length:216 start_codon:yes stop_codon:yes gene_type:complete